MLDRILGRTVQQETKTKATAAIKAAIDAYVEQEVQTTRDLTIVIDELAQVIGFECARLLVSRIAVGRGLQENRPRYHEGIVPTKYDAKNAETR